MAQGYQQTEGVDYTETFSPLVKQPTVRVVLSLALQFGWTMKQWDVSNAFLHGHLHEQVFIRHPQGYVNADLPYHVYHLHKALYGLKQAPRHGMTCYLNLCCLLVSKVVLQILHCLCFMKDLMWYAFWCMLMISSLHDLIQILLHHLLLN